MVLVLIDLNRAITSSSYLYQPDLFLINHSNKQIKSNQIPIILKSNSKPNQAAFTAGKLAKKLSSSHTQKWDLPRMTFSCLFFGWLLLLKKLKNIRMQFLNWPRVETIDCKRLIHISLNKTLFIIRQVFLISKNVSTFGCY